MSDVPIALPPFDPMLQAVGRGIQSFASVEAFLSKIFALLLHPAPQTISLIALDAARHLETKLRMTRKVGNERLTTASLPEFNKLMERVKDRAGMRHKLAHWTTAPWHPEGNLMADRGKNVEIRLIPNYWTASNLAFVPEHTIRLEQIEEFIGKCHELSTALVNYVIQLQRWIEEAEQRGDILVGKIGS